VTDLGEEVVAALRRTQCCGCGGPLPQDGPLNIVEVNRVSPGGRLSFVTLRDNVDVAAAVECDACLLNGTAPKTAVEVRADGTVVHHDVAALRDLPARVGVPA
jgi:hypothetical protein